MKRTGAAILVLAVFVAGALLLLNRSSKLRVSETHAVLLRIADRSVDYRPLFEGLNAIRSTWGARPAFCVNTRFDPNCANVLIVDLSKSDKIGSDRLSDLLRQARKNAIALPPNLIIVDRELVYLLLVETHSLVVSHANYLSDRDPFVSAQTALAVASLASTEIIRTNDIPGFYWAGKDWTLDEFALELFRGVFDPGKTTDESGIIKAVFQLSMALLLEHEAEHLEANSGTFGQNPLLSRLSEAEIALTREEEDKADAAALAAMRRYIAFYAGSKDDTVAGWFRNPYFASLPFLVEAEYWRDSALVAGLDGFRGFKVGDLTLEVSHRACDAANPERTDFYDPRAIVAARRKPLPILTKDEFDQQRLAFAQSDRPQTHAHNLLRAENVYDALERSSAFSFDHLRLDAHVRFLEALQTGDPKKAFLDSTGFRPIPVTNLADFLKGTSRFVEYTPAVTCPLSHCYVGRIENDRGYIEIIGTKDHIAELRLIMDLGKPLSASTTESEAKKYIESLVQHIKIIMVFSQMRSEDNPEEIIDLVAQLREGLFVCGAASAFRVDEARRITYHATSLERPGFIQLRAFSAEEMGPARSGVDERARPARLRGREEAREPK